MKCPHCGSTRGWVHWILVPGQYWYVLRSSELWWWHRRDDIHQMQVCEACGEAVS